MREWWFVHKKTFKLFISLPNWMDVCQTTLHSFSRFSNFFFVFILHSISHGDSIKYLTILSVQFFYDHWNRMAYFGLYFRFLPFFPLDFIVVVVVLNVRINHGTNVISSIPCSTENLFSNCLVSSLGSPKRLTSLISIVFFCSLFVYCQYELSLVNTDILKSMFVCVCWANLHLTEANLLLSHFRLFLL